MSANLLPLYNNKAGLPLDKPALDALADTAFAMADSARPACLKHFRQTGLGADNKDHDGGYDPVTVADKEAEEAMRHVLANQRPNDAILGEEHGLQAGTTGLQWVLDPIDGTRAFIAGAASWGVLIGLNDGARVRFGVLDQPFTGERFWGDCDTAFWQRGDETRKLETRKNVGIHTALICSTFPEVGDASEQAAFHRLANQCQLTRYGMDCYAYGLLAAGHIDLVVEAGLNPYDIQALIPIIEGAGGVITTWDGKNAMEGGRVIAAGSLELHKAAMAELNR